MSFRRCLLAGVALAFCVDSASAALVTTITGKRTVRTGGTYQIRTTTRGQRQIIITVDPSVTTAFRLDVSYPSGIVTPDGFTSFGNTLAPSAIEYVPPYGNLSAPTSQLVNATIDGTRGGLISNVEGALLPALDTVAGFGPVTDSPAPNNSSGGSDLFRLIFNDNNPGVEKVFQILGFDSKGVSADNAPYVADNFLTARIDDPQDPDFGQFVTFSGEQIQQSFIVVPAEDTSGNPGGVPLPPAVWGGLALGGIAVWRTRRR